MTLVEDSIISLINAAQHPPGRLFSKMDGGNLRDRIDKISLVTWTTAHERPIKICKDRWFSGMAKSWRICRIRRWNSLFSEHFPPKKSVWSFYIIGIGLYRKSPYRGKSWLLLKLRFGVQTGDIHGSPFSTSLSCGIFKSLMLFDRNFSCDSFVTTCTWV